MGLVTEYIDSLPLTSTIYSVTRDEGQLFIQPDLGPIKLLDHAPLSILHFPLHYTPAKFSPPKPIYESPGLRFEYQDMNGRQPFYHRNADVDELSYQVCGARTLMTEHGTLEQRAGDFSRIPVGVAHDNYGREDIHLLFYVPTPVVDSGPVYRRAETPDVPFEGWTPKPGVAEVMTECLGAGGCDIAVSAVSERLYFEHAKCVEKSELIHAMRYPPEMDGIVWMFKSERVWIGEKRSLQSSAEKPVYTRRRVAHEIQGQLEGRRVLVTQRGTVELGPGDFVCVPNGVAFTEVPLEESRHLVVLSCTPPEVKAEVVRSAKAGSGEDVRLARERVVGG